MQSKLTLAAAVTFILLAAAVRAEAHAELVKSEPPASATLAHAPAEIRLWFTEPLEPNFSKITLRDGRGEPINLPSASVDPSDPTQLFVRPDGLAEGVYTVIWNVVSAADGHATSGSFAFSVGVSVGLPENLVAPGPESIPLDSALIRWLNFVAGALLAGSVGFALFVWSPVLSGNDSGAGRRLRGVMWAGWALSGIAGALLLALQAATAASIPIGGILADPALVAAIFGTRFGALWAMRMALWALAGGALLLAGRDQRFYWPALALSAGVLLTTSLFSHASAARDYAAVLGDWLHFLLSALWVGGLVAFAVVIVPVMGKKRSLPVLADLVGYFSNYARVAVIGLAITGLYAAWLQVGSLEALRDTLYGQALLLKLLLFLPLLGIAAINLLLTARGLRAGRKVWAGRLRGLLGAEIALTLGVFALVGLMTAVAPARTAAARASAPPASVFLEETMVDDGLHIRLTVSPRRVGVNTYTVYLWSMVTSQSISDASRVFLRFRSLSEDLQRTELDLVPIGKGEYQASGPNLSLPGDWQVRVTVRREGHYDSLADFNIPVEAAPPPVDPGPTLPERAGALLMAGLGLLAGAGYFVAANLRRLLTGPGLLGVAMALIAVAHLQNGLSVAGRIEPSAAPPIVVSEAYLYATARTASDTLLEITAAYMIIQNNGNHDETLTSVQTDVAGITHLHRTAVENDLAQMTPLSDLRIPARGKLELRPGGDHVMLSDLKSALLPGQKVTLRLKFESGAVVTVDAVARLP